MITKFLFMGEKYADRKAPPKAQVTSLTGVLIPAAVHRVFRERFYGLVADAIGDPDHTISKWPHELIHASELLPDSTDKERFSFFEGLVSLVNELEFGIYRIGYFGTRQNVSGLGGESGIIATCFLKMLHVLKDGIADSQVWPVMEIDHSNRQDQCFAGMVQMSDYAFSRFGGEDWWVSNANFGEVLYITKRSGYGALVDCVAYLLHARWLRSIDPVQTPYKERLAEIASNLTTVARDVVSPLTVG